MSDSVRRLRYPFAVTSLRRLLLDHRALSAWMVALALLMKLLVPAGFMPVVSSHGLAIELCAGFGPQKMAMAQAMPGMAHHTETLPADKQLDRQGQQHKPDHPGKDMPCAFSGLSAPSLAATDALLLAIAIAFILAGIFRAVAIEHVVLPAFLRPPLRGPPTFS